MVHRVTNSAKNQQLCSPKPQPPRSNSKDPRLTPGVFLVIRTKAGHPLSKSTAKQNRADAPAYENRPYFFLFRSGFSPIGPAGAPNAHRAILLFFSGRDSGPANSPITPQGSIRNGVHATRYSTDTRHGKEQNTDGAGGSPVPSVFSSDLYPPCVTRSRCRDTVSDCPCRFDRQGRSDPYRQRRCRT